MGEERYSVEQKIVASKHYELRTPVPENYRKIGIAGQTLDSSSVNRFHDYDYLKVAVRSGFPSAFPDAFRKVELYTESTRSCPSGEK